MTAFSKQKTQCCFFFVLFFCVEKIENKAFYQCLHYSFRRSMMCLSNHDFYQELLMKILVAYMKVFHHFNCFPFCLVETIKTFYFGEGRKISRQQYFFQDTPEALMEECLVGRTGRKRCYFKGAHFTQKYNASDIQSNDLLCKEVRSLILKALKEIADSSGSWEYQGGPIKYSRVTLRFDTPMKPSKQCQIHLPSGVLALLGASVTCSGSPAGDCPLTDTCPLMMTSSEKRTFTGLDFNLAFLAALINADLGDWKKENILLDY